MKLTYVKSLLIAVSTFFAITAHSEERVVATVDGYPILQSQVKKALGKRANNEANRKAATDEIIDDFLVKRAIEQSGIKINYARVDQAIEDIARQNGITYGQLLDVLDYQGISLSQYRQQIAHQMLIEQVKHQTLSQTAPQVDPAEVESLAMKMLSDAQTKGTLKAITGTQYRISHILIKTNPVLNDAQAKAKLATLKADIQSGKISFEEAAKANSLDYASGAEGGDLGWNFLETYDPAFAKTAHQSKTGVISAPFKSQFGWHILKVTETRQADRTEDAYFQKAYEQLVNKQAQAASQDWVKTLKNQAEVKYY